MKMKIAACFASALALQACSKIDDYMLGKDNTPAPKALKEIKSKKQVAQQWSVPVGKASRSKDYLKLKPITEGGQVYAADVSGHVQAINKNSGSVLWSTQLPHGIVSGPVVHGNYIAVGTNAATLGLINKTNGKILWENKVSSELLAKPVLAKDKVIAKTIDGKVYAFSVTDGKELWKYEHGSPALILKASSSPIILGNLVVVGFSDGKMDAFDLDTGTVMWQRSIAFSNGVSDVERLVDIDADPIVKNNIAYVASYQGYVGAFSLETGQFLWQRPASVYKNMALNSDSLFYTDSNDVLWSLDTHTGKVNWKQTAFKARGLTEPVIRGKELVVGDKQGFLHVLEIQSGEEIARSQLSSGVAFSPLVSGKNVYVMTENGILNKLSVG